MPSGEGKSARDSEFGSAPQIYLAQRLIRLLGWMSADRQRVWRLRSNLQIIVGIILLVLGYWIGGDHARLVFFGQHTTGKLVGYRQENFSTDAGGVKWASASMPVIEFTTGHGVVRFRDWMASNFRIPMGGYVQVLYDPAHPANAVVDRPIWNFVPWAPMFAVALLLLVSGIRGRMRPS